MNVPRAFLTFVSIFSNVAHCCPLLPIVAHCCPLLPILYLQRDSIAAYDADPDNLVACFRASLFQHTLTTPIQANKAAEGYMKVLEGHAGHNASLHFCIGVLLLSGHRFTGHATDEEFVQYMSQRMQGLTQTKQQLMDKEDKQFNASSPNGIGPFSIFKR